MKMIRISIDLTPEVEKILVKEAKDSFRERKQQIEFILSDYATKLTS